MIMRKVCVFAVFALAAGDAAAETQVFLNGVNIDGVTNKVFAEAKVEIDAAGNVYITTGSSGSPRGEALSTGKPPTRRYWLVTEKAAAGMTQYDVDLFVNGKWVRRFLAREDHVVMEVTKHFVAGPNTVHFVANKKMDKGRRSRSPQHYFRIVLGEGTKGGRNVMINRKLIDYKRTAAETEEFKDKYTVTVF
ncbi:MAG: hypothetical protein AAF654_06095 [Myxococcota bacterium]